MAFVSERREARSFRKYGTSRYDFIRIANQGAGLSRAAEIAQAAESRRAEGRRGGKELVTIRLDVLLFLRSSILPSYGVLDEFAL